MYKFSGTQNIFTNIVTMFSMLDPHNFSSDYWNSSFQNGGRVGNVP